MDDFRAIVIRNSCEPRPPKRKNKDSPLNIDVDIERVWGGEMVDWRWWWAFINKKPVHQQASKR